MTLSIRPAEECRYDLVALGEIMLRLDPGEDRVRTARSFRVWEGGGEYNVARGLRRCFGMRTAVVTAFADNDVGRLLEDFVLQGGVDTSLDALGGLRRDRPHSPKRAQLHRARVRRARRARRLRPGQHGSLAAPPGDVDWEHLFGTLGVRWFHTGGIFAGLSETTPDVDRGGRSRPLRGTAPSSPTTSTTGPVSGRGSAGLERAREVNRRLATRVDVMLGNEEDFTACLGLEVEGVDENLTELDTAAFRAMIERASAEYPNFAVVATTLRAVRSATVNDWSAIAWSRDRAVRGTDTPPDDLEILDRVGGGDSFASGFDLRPARARRPAGKRSSTALRTVRWR